jgi:hypothetical protein
MLINLNGKLFNYNNTQGVRPNIVHVDFLEKETRDNDKNEYFEIVVMPKIYFTVDLEDSDRGTVSQEFNVEVCPKPLGQSEGPGNYWTGFNNGKVGMPDIEYDIVDGTFHWRTHFMKMSWPTFRFDKYNYDHETIEKPSDEELKAWKLKVRRNIEKNAAFYVMRALNDAARRCRKA